MHSVNVYGMCMAECHSVWTPEKDLFTLFNWVLNSLLVTINSQILLKD